MQLTIVLTGESFIFTEKNFKFIIINLNNTNGRDMKKILKFTLISFIVFILFIVIGRKIPPVQRYIYYYSGKIVNYFYGDQIRKQLSKELRNSFQEHRENRIKNERNERQVLDKRTIELVKKIRSKQKDLKEKMAKFLVLSSTFSKKETIIGEYPIIKLIVKNNTPYAISKVVFYFRLITPGRAVPWIEKEMGYEISGGLEPGEHAEWELVVNQFSKWGTIEPSYDKTLECQVSRLYDPDGKLIFPVFEPEYHFDAVRACFAQQRVLLGAIEMYNMDNKNGIKTNDGKTIIDQQIFSLLLSEGYLKSPIKPLPGCKLLTTGNITETGEIECELHGSVIGNFYQIEREKFVSLFQNPITKPEESLADKHSLETNLDAKNLTTTVKTKSEILIRKLKTLDLTLIKSTDFPESYGNLYIPEKLDGNHIELDALTTTERIKRVLNNGVEDLAIKVCDFNNDGTEDLFLEVRLDKNFFLFFFNGAKKSLSQVKTLKWNNLFYMRFQDETKQILICSFSYCDKINLGYVDNKIVYVNTRIYDYESESLECSDNYTIKVEKITDRWVFLTEVYNGKPRKMILSKKVFLETGFVWGNRVNVRNGYGNDLKKTKVLFQLNNGNMVKILDEKDGWYKITNVDVGSQFCGNHKECWIKGDYLKNLPPPMKRD